MFRRFLHIQAPPNRPSISSGKTLPASGPKKKKSIGKTNPPWIPLGGVSKSDSIHKYRPSSFRSRVLGSQDLIYAEPVNPELLGSTSKDQQKEMEAELTRNQLEAEG